MNLSILYTFVLYPPFFRFPISICCYAFVSRTDFLSASFRTSTSNKYFFMTKMLPEKNLAFDHENAKKGTLTFEIDKTDANEKYEIQAFQRNRLAEKNENTV